LLVRLGMGRLGPAQTGKAKRQSRYCGEAAVDSQ